MPPRVGGIVARLAAAGYVLKRRGKGDHSVYYNAGTDDQITIDGGPNHEVPKPVWRKLQKQFGWRDQ